MTVVSDANQEIVTEVYIPTELFDIVSDTVHLYALDAKTIGVANIPPRLWTDIKMWDGIAKVVKEEGELMIILPNEFVRFYKPRIIELAALERKDTVLLIIAA